jgi:hypothetical protein
MGKIYRLKREHLNTYNYNTDDNKLRANQMYANLIEHYNLSGGAHFFLESVKLLTSTTLSVIGIDVGQMHIAERNEGDYLTMCQHLLNVWHGSTIDYFSQTNTIFNSIWLDYTGSAYGNKSQNHNPCKDLQTILYRNLIQNNGIIGFTFSTRNGKRDGRLRRNRPYRCHLPLYMLQQSHRYKLFDRLEDQIAYKEKQEIISVCETAFIGFSQQYDYRVVDFFKYERINRKQIMYTFFIQVHRL